jgi:hypothetical protein
MRIESFIGFLNQPTVKTLLTRARFVSGDQQNSAPSRVESEGYPPNTSLGIEPKLLHIVVL